MTYADKCIKRAKQSAQGTWKVSWTTQEGNDFLIESREMVPELARRLKRAISYLNRLIPDGAEQSFINELEAMPKEAK